MTDAGNRAEARIASLQKRGADRYDPVRFGYIVSLARRAQGKAEPVRRIIQQKVLKAIDDYQSGFDQAKEEARAIVDRFSAENSDSAAAVEELYGTCDFSGIRRKVKSLQNRDGMKLLAALTQQLNNTSPLYDSPKTRLTLYERLLQQEVEVLQDVTDSHDEKAASCSDSKVELRTYRLFTEMLAKQQSEYLVNDAIVNRPENPGHLNSQMLATRSLAFVRRVSPAYLNRLVVFIDTLFMLEKLE